MTERDRSLARPLQKTANLDDNSRAKKIDRVEPVFYADSRLLDKLRRMQSGNQVGTRIHTNACHGRNNEIRPCAQSFQGLVNPTGEIPARGTACFVVFAGYMAIERSFDEIASM